MQKAESSEKICDIWLKIQPKIIKVITNIFPHNCATITVASSGSLPLEKRTTLRNIIIRVKSVWNKGKNNYILLEKASYELLKRSHKNSFCVNNSILKKCRINMN